jgi:hypothetical protein
MLHLWLGFSWMQPCGVLPRQCISWSNHWSPAHQYVCGWNWNNTQNSVHHLRSGQKSDEKTHE